MNPPELKPCPQCTSMYCGQIACRFSGLQHEKVVPLPGAPFYGPDIFTAAEDLDDGPRSGISGIDEEEDRRLDDPRHGQAAGLNRRYE